MDFDEKYFPATAMPDSDWWAALWPDPAGVVRSLGVMPDMVVIDLCCGDGYFTAPLAQILGEQVYGVDIDPAMLERTRTALDRFGIGTLNLICADARDLPEFLPVKVDYVLIANTFHGVPEKSELAHAVAAVLKTCGQCAIVNWHPLPRERTVVLGKPRGPKTVMRLLPEMVCSIVKPAGFTMDRIVALPSFHYGAIFHVADANPTS